MPKKMQDLTGLKFNMLTVVRFVRKVDSPKEYIWLVKCECGTEKEMSAHSIRRSVSCGCYRLKVVSESTLKDLTGKRFGKLNVISRAGSDKHRNARWIVMCDCGNEKEVNGSTLIAGKTVSCGCYNSEKSVENKWASTHDKSYTRLYKIWCNMKQRCYNTSDTHYYTYGGRDIIVCEEWNKSFDSFYNWSINNGYSEGLTIDRINVNGNYCPENCQWLTMSENVIKANTIDKQTKRGA